MDQKDLPDNIVSLPEELTLESMDLTGRIELLNALRYIRDQLPKLKKASPEIERYIHRQFIGWVDSHIKTVLGEPQESVFSAKEIEVLKALAAKVQQKQEAPVSGPAPVATTATAPQNTAQRPTPTSLKESFDVTKFRKSQEDFLRQLEAMDRDAPQF